MSVSRCGSSGIKRIGKYELRYVCSMYEYRVRVRVRVRVMNVGMSIGVYKSKYTKICVCICECLILRTYVKQYSPSLVPSSTG